MRTQSRFYVWPSLLAVLAVALAGCGRAGGAPNDPSAVPPAAADELAADQGELPPDAVQLGSVAHLAQLRRQGQFDAFASAALAASAEEPADASLGMLAVEALLATGQDQRAGGVALEAADLALADGDSSLAAAALRLWTVARFRQSLPCDDPRFADTLARIPRDEPLAELPRFWRDALHERAPYRLADSSASEPTELAVAGAAAGSLAAELCAVEAKANGQRLPLVFVDTGAQHNLMTIEAARAAGVALGANAMHLVGFAGLSARPGVIHTLELGGLTLHDVPVLVGRPAPLVASGGQLTLSIELMQHVRFTIDYPRRQVFAAPAKLAAATTQTDSRQIPLWTFSQACLAQALLPSGTTGRALVDTGDRRGTFVAGRWARRHLAGFQRADASLVFKYKQRDLVIDEMQLGAQSMRNWPVLDTFPRALERLDLVDVLIGHDLLYPYRLTIDLPARALWLCESTPIAPGEATGAREAVP